MRSFFQSWVRGFVILGCIICCIGAVQRPVDAARCGCVCNDDSAQTGALSGRCTAGACDSTCRTQCATHRGVSAASCTEDPSPAPAPTSGALCECGCGDGLSFAPPTGGSCGPSSCTSVCTAACTGHGGVTGEVTCDDGSNTLPAPGSCVQRALNRPGMSASRRRAQEETIARIERQPGNAARTAWTCQSLEGDQINENRCVPLGCEGTPFCCVPGTGSAPVTTSESGGAPTPDGETPTSPTETCAQVALRRGTTQGTIDTVARNTNTDPSVWVCKRVCAREQRTSCVQRGCPDTESDVLCCPPSIGIPAGQTCGGRGASSSGGGTGSSSSSTGIGIARLVLPSCATTRDPRSAGKCQIADVFELGYSAVRFMFGLSGALLLVAFVVSGFKYLVNGYAGDIKTAKETMVNATLGMVIMLFAYIVVTFLYTALVGENASSFTNSNAASRPTTNSAQVRSTTSGGSSPSASRAPSAPATGPSGTCRCAPSGLASLLVSAATEDQVRQAESACTGARAGARFDRSAFVCTGPASESECRLVQTELNRQLPTGISAECTWSS